jgi:nucleoside-diphosphate-sugar epimerase
MKILIAGGAGFIGSNLTSSHLQKKDEVVVIDNLITGSEKNIDEFKLDKNFQFIKADIVTFDFTSLSTFDIVYHLASPASPPQYQKYSIETLQTNSLGTNNLLDFFRKSKSRTFVFTSTSEIYGDPLVHPQIETYFGNVNSVGPRSCYDEGKRFAEALCMAYVRKYYLNIRIARVFNTYGPKMEKIDGRVVSNFITQALTHKPITIYGDGSYTRSFCYVSDMVEGLMRLAAKKNIGGEIFNLGNPCEKSILYLATMIKKLIASRSVITHLPTPVDDPKRRKPDITKAKSILRWSPKMPLETGLKKTIEYFRKIV